MLDDLHNDLMGNIAFVLESNRDDTSLNVAPLEGTFVGVLRSLAQRESELTTEDWWMVASWLVECEEYFRGFDWFLGGISFPGSRWSFDLAPFVAKARAHGKDRWKNRRAQALETSPTPSE